MAVYTRPRDPDIPLVCLDATSKQLIAETRAPIKMKEGRPVRFDYEYERNGTANLFMMFAPLEGWRHVKVTDRHTAMDYAHALKDLSDTRFPNARKIILVQDNLNTHKPASLHQAFPAAEARRQHRATLDDAAFGAAGAVAPKFISPSDPAAQWTGAHKGHAFFASAANHLIDTQNAVILDVEANRAVRQAEVGASRTMIDRTAQRFGLKPKQLATDSAYGSAANLAWLVKERRSEPHIPVFDKSSRTDGTFSRSDVVFDPARNRATCPQGKLLAQFRRSFKTPRSGVAKDGTRLYRAGRSDCQACVSKPRCRPNAPHRKVPCDLAEDARDLARSLAGTPAFEKSRHLRKKIEMLFAHLNRILGRGRLRLRGPGGARDEFLLAATAQNLRKLAKLRSTPPAFAQKSRRGRALARPNHAGQKPCLTRRALRRTRRTNRRHPREHPRAHRASRSLFRRDGRGSDRRPDSRAQEAPIGRASEGAGGSGGLGPIPIPCSAKSSV